MKSKIIGTAQIQINLVGEVYRDDEAGCFVAYNKRFNIFSQGVTQTRAEAALEDAIYGYFDVLHNLNTKSFDDR